jgi:hypothetical protein
MHTRLARPLNELRIAEGIKKGARGADSAPSCGVLVRGVSEQKRAVGGWDE